MEKLKPGEHLTKTTHCKTCMATLNGHMSTEKPEISPRPKDISVCYYCGTVSKFDKELNLVSVTLEELDWIKRKQPDSWKLLEEISEKIKQKIQKN